jgi:HORMA domain
MHRQQSAIRSCRVLHLFIHLCTTARSVKPQGQQYCCLPQSSHPVPNGRCAKELQCGNQGAPQIDPWSTTTSSSVVAICDRAEFLLIRSGRRNVGLNLFYTDDCPESYEPKGFTKCTDDSLHFPGGPALATKSEKPCNLVAGTHSISLVVSHVDSIDDEVQMNAIPEDIEYANKRSRLDEYTIPRENVTIPSPELSSRQVPVYSQPVLPSSSLIPSARAPSTQTREDIQTREALQQMQRSSSRPRDWIATQTLANENHADSGDFRVVEKSFTDTHLDDSQLLPPRERVIVSSKMAELIIHVKAIQNRCSANALPFDQKALDRSEIKRTRRSTRIRCECMDDVEEGFMVCRAQRLYSTV